MWWWAGAALAQEPGSTPAPVELDLDEALDRLRNEGPDLAQAQARADATRGLAREIEAAFLPYIAVNGGYTHNDIEVQLDLSKLLGQIAPGTPPPPQAQTHPLTIQPLQVWTGSVNASIPLVAPVAWADYAAARHDADRMQANADDIDLQLQSSLVSLAASEQAAQGLADAAARARALAEEQLKSTQVAVEAGTAEPVDVLTARADVARRESEVVRTRNELLTAEEAVGALLGVDGPVLVTIPSPPPVDNPVLERPALVAAREQLETADARITSAWARHLPTVAATGIYQAQTETFLTGRKTTWHVGVNATWVLYDGGFRYGRLDQARADQASAVAFQTAEKLRLDRELRNAQRDVEAATQVVELSEQQLAAANQAARVAQLGLQAGTVSALQARDVALTAYQADVTLAAARARLLTAQAALRLAQGHDQRW